MFVDNALMSHLRQNNSIKVNSLVVAEWNQNIYDNIENYGNYRWNPSAELLYSLYDSNDVENKYTNALESSYLSEYRTDDPNEPLVFLTQETERKLYYPLIDCFNPFRPRSGINKMLFFEKGKKFVDSIRSSGRPRYYFASRKDQFKYWTSYREDNGVEVGISLENPVTTASAGYIIKDANPFVVYKDAVATNRIVVKMQTNLANPNVVDITGNSIIKSQIRTSGTKKISDPFLDRSRSTVPLRWKIQYLNSNNEWINAISFDENSLRQDSSHIVNWDGYVEIAYGINIPTQFKQTFNLIGYIDSSSQLSDYPVLGEAYIVGSNSNSPGNLYIWDGDEWNIFAVNYGFSLVEESDIKRLNLVTKLSDPYFYTQDSNKIYKEFIFIKGIRVVVERMFGPEKQFELIEISPRLKADLTLYASDFGITKDIAATDFSLPVGGLAATTGRVRLSNHDSAFTENNIFNTSTGQGSIIYNNLKPQIRFDFYEGIINVNGYDKYVPLKSMYSENSANASDGSQDVSLSLRDMFFRLENSNATPMLIQNCKLTMAVALLLDNIGFSNYIFKSINNANDPLIPFFFVDTESSVAEVLQRLAQATQTAMFFDEYNNFVVMPKEYLLPDIEIPDGNTAISTRLLTLYGQKSGSGSATIVPNIEALSNVDTAIVNDGEINYSIRNIQRAASSLSQAFELEQDRTYGYLPSLLWQLGSDKAYKEINEIGASSSDYALSAVPLNTTLTSLVPEVVNGQIINNIIDIGENANFLTRFQGYLYSNGEIIRYDAQQFSVSNVGNVWITDSVEYQKYASKLEFNGKIYPTGVIRIFAEPFYNDNNGVTEIVNGNVRAHGRGQFGTSIVSHSAGLDSYWTNIDNRKSFRMDSSYLFSNLPITDISYPALSSPVSYSIGQDLESAQKTEVLGKIANFLRKSVRSENNYSISSNSATVQTSSLFLSGPKTFDLSAGSPIAATDPRDVVNYIYKPLDNNYKHVGTRMRILGKQVGKKQQAINQSTLSVVTTSEDGSTVEITGSSGGLGVLINPDNNSGYYFEIAALAEDVSKYFNNSASVSSSGSATAVEVIHDVMFYKVTNKPKASPETGKNTAVPIKLWGTYTGIISDSAVFAGLDRFISQDRSSTYDLAVEWEQIDNTTYKFYLYVNNVLIATVIDPQALTTQPFTACLFNRASSICMFDNVYALKNNLSQQESVTAISAGELSNNESIISNMTNTGVSVAESLRKYAMSGIIQATYLSSIGSEKPSTYDIYFDEFGTIMRECVYFNIKYDQAYPAFIASMNPPVSAERSYVVGGFVPGSYGAEFMLFNATDGVVQLGDSSANSVSISGITFTQNVSNTVTVDDYFKELSNMSDPVVSSSGIVSPQMSQKTYNDIRSSRSIYGKKSFVIDSPYIQDTDSAKSLMRWIISKTLSPRKVIELDAFAIPHVQLGDIVKIDYDLPEGVKFVDTDKRFVVVSVNYERASGNITSQLRLLEV